MAVCEWPATPAAEFPPRFEKTRDIGALTSRGYCDPPVLARRGLVSTDIERFAARSAPDQHEAQRAHEWAVGRAAADAGLVRDAWLRQPAGDGEFVILPEGVHEPRVIAVMLTALAARLREYNRSRVTDLRVRLRVAVHHGLVHLDGAAGACGPATVVVARLLNCQPVRDILRYRAGVNVAAVVSREVYEDVVANRYEGLRPELFQRVHVQDRDKGFAAQAWVYAPEEDVTRPVPLAAVVPISPAPAAKPGRRYV